MLGFLPWERWLPPYVFGPLLCLCSILVLFNYTRFAWWQLILSTLSGLFGAYGTWVWAKTGKNIFLVPSKADSEDAAAKFEKHHDT